ncbi:MAG TPA: CcmD family protein [Methylomirabilota bacterium]|jgi:CcmD family protein|nr:CcmD family protein [Methylomirabilota bacterium]
MTYLFAAFCATWLALFFYLLALARRQRALSQEIDMLRQMLEKRNPQTRE